MHLPEVDVQGTSLLQRKASMSHAQPAGGEAHVSMDSNDAEVTSLATASKDYADAGQIDALEKLLDQTDASAMFGSNNKVAKDSAGEDDNNDNNNEEEEEE